VRARLIVVGPLPPPYHGVSVSTGLILANRELQRRFAVEHLDTSDHRSGANVGRWDLLNTLGALRAVARLAGRLRGPPGLVYLPISQGLPGLTRDALMIRLAALRGWRVAAHLRGSELNSVYEQQPPVVKSGLRRMLGRLDSVAVLGESLRGAVDGLVAPERVAVVPNGTPDPDPPEIPRQPALGLYLSNLRRRKGALEAMRAALLVLRKRPDSRFVFAGECREVALEQELRELASRSDGRIELRASVGGEEKRQLLATSTFLLFPPVEPEGHPRVVLEAIAAGLPVIATDRGAIAETVVDGESGYVLPDPDPAELADRALRLLESSELRDSMSGAARARYLDRFTEAAADRALADWLERTLKSPGATS
jgi:glycosyltransferase involved in cell wall biosynthesis